MWPRYALAPREATKGGCDDRYHLNGRAVLNGGAVVEGCRDSVRVLRIGGSLCQRKGGSGARDSLTSPGVLIGGDRGRHDQARKRRGNYPCFRCHGRAVRL